MGKIIAITNQKGGVGKTTTAVNLSAAVGALGKKVLMVDIDPQGSATSGYGINKRTTSMSTYNIMIGSEKTKSTIIKTKFKNVDVIPASIGLAGAEIELVDLKDREIRLKYALSQVRDDYDYIFIDCPPSLGLITINGLTASDTIIVPIQCEYYALEGLTQLISTVRSVKRLYNSSIEIEGVLLTMYDGRLNLTIQVVEQVKQYFPKQVYKTTIPRNVRISEAPSHGLPILYYDNSSKGAKAYTEVAKELIKQNMRGR